MVPAGGGMGGSRRDMITPSGQLCGNREFPNIGVFLGPNVRVFVLCQVPE